MIENKHKTTILLIEISVCIFLFASQALSHCDVYINGRYWCHPAPTCSINGANRTVNISCSENSGRVSVSGTGSADNSEPGASPKYITTWQWYDGSSCVSM